MRRLRILFCLEDLCFGGTQRQTLALVRRLDTTRFAPSLLIFTGPTDLDLQAREAGLPITYLGSSRRVYPFFFAAMGPHLLREKPDLLVPCTALPNIWARLWGALVGIPVIGTCRGGGAPTRQHERFLWRLTAHIICNTEELKADLCRRAIPEEHITVIHNGIAAERYAPSTPPSSRPPCILCVARLAADKDHLTLFRAFQEVHEHVQDATLCILGDGPKEAELKAWAAAHPNLPITFAPGTQDVRPYYAKARLFALSSVREGQPNVLLEAMSSALPICATAVGGIPTLLTHEKTALLSRPGDSHGLAVHMLRLLADPLAADRLGAAAFAIVRTNYAFAPMVAAHEALFLRYAKPSS